MTGARIMANIAKKRGRPPEVSEEMRQFYAATQLYGRAGRRQQDNRRYFFVGFELLFPKSENGHEYADPIFIFLCDIAVNKWSKTTIISEIGRLSYRFGNEIALDAARVICEHKMNTARAVNYISRLKKDLTTDKTRLRWLPVYMKIARLIDDSCIDEEDFEPLLNNLIELLSPENHEGE